MITKSGNNFDEADSIWFFYQNHIVNLLKTLQK